jgi:hypothetical protein
MDDWIFGPIGDDFDAIRQKVAEINQQQLEEYRWTHQYTLKNGVTITLGIPAADRRWWTELWNQLSKEDS